MSTYWWLEQVVAISRFILREVSSIFVAWFVVYLLLLIDAVGQGPIGYARFLAWSASAVGARAERRQLSVHRLPRGHLVRPGAAGDGRPRRPQRRVPGHLVLAGSLRRVGWSASAIVAWLLVG